MAVGRRQVPEHAVTQRAHRLALEPALAVPRHDDDQLGSVGLTKAVGQCRTQHALVKYWLSM